MRNILFYYDNACGPESHGGTEVATFRIANAIKESGEYRVFNAYLRGVAQENLYDGVIKLHKSHMSEELARYIKTQNIDVVVNMGRFFRHRKLKEAIVRSGKNVRLIFMHHFAPGSEKKKPTFSAGFRLLRLDPANPLYWLRATIYPLVKLPRTLNLKSIYRTVYETSDRIVLLSDGYRSEYTKIAGIPGDLEDKFRAIPNIYQPSETEDSELKQKRVLILSRMDEIQKRVSVAMKVWKEIEGMDDLAAWRLDIVGSGHDMKSLKKLARRLGLQRAEFHGWKDGKPFLQRSAVLMSTSDYEGLSLAMIEAQRYGCVPVAFDSYASLHDIVEDGNTGIIVASRDDIKDYATRLASLLRNSHEREMMGCYCRENSLRFTSAAVSEKWRKLFEDL